MAIGGTNVEAPKPLCVIFGEQLANEAMVSTKFMHHLKTKHAIHAHKNKNYFHSMLSQNEKQDYFMNLSFTVSEKN